MNQKQMVAHKEDSNDFGGYFIVNGKERIIRLLTAQRRNYPLALTRKSWKGAGDLFSEYGVIIRCVRSDQTSANMVLHYLNNGTSKLKIFVNRQPHFLPLMIVLKGLLDVTDYFIFKGLTKGRENDSFYCSCCVNMLRIVQMEGFRTQAEIRKYVGSKFRIRYTENNPEWLTDEEVADGVFRETIACHLNTNEDKFNLLIHMNQKLFSVAKGMAACENPDNPMFHEIYLSGHIFFTLLLERIQMFLDGMKYVIKRRLELDSVKKKGLATLGSSTQFLKACLASKFGEIVRPMNALIATGNLLSRSGLGLQQTTGLSVMAEKINYWRFLSHFRAVHRGSFFAEMKTTTCRKLYPEAWGFLCPVHTPDGSPCGLLNHLAEMCLVTNQQPSVKLLPQVMAQMGMIPANQSRLPSLDSDMDSTDAENNNMIDCNNQYLDVLLDGKVIGFIELSKIDSIVTQLRCLKVNVSKVSGDHREVPSTLEIGLIKPTEAATQYPGLYMFSTPARMIRPVLNLRGTDFQNEIGKKPDLELIGTFEQPYLEIAVVADEKHDLTTHCELRQTSMLSILAGMIPFPDFNQSPRNMYSCQMNKQTMGVPSHTLKYRSDHKMYGISSMQSPLVRPALHDHYLLDDYPMGANGIVAVISYTGYDMEDALILNKASVERGFKHGIIERTEIVDLNENAKHGGYASMGADPVFMFGKGIKISSDSVPVTNDPKIEQLIDADGLPIIGVELNYDDPICCYYEMATGKISTIKYKQTEPARVADIKLLGSDSGCQVLQKIAIKLLINRQPIIGDKFANRHGQKGVISFLWPQESMPFCGSSGITPDILFNPHGYPSRMTIGMMIESMAGKAAAAEGVPYDATPFVFSEKNPASEYFGQLLHDAGFNYYGTDLMYSGVDGRCLKAEIFVGLLYYIRLRHMVGDKYQVRSTGPIDPLTHQPVKGRKRAGGIRFGEMERDSLLAHGSSFLLHDRLFNCSDKTSVYGCSTCKSIISPYLVRNDHSMMGDEGITMSDSWSCRTCDSRDGIKKVSIPYVLRYLISELASVNIKVLFEFK